MFKKMTAILLFLCVFGFANDLATIQSTKKVRIGVRLSQPPFSVLNSNNEFEGFEAELAKKLGEKLVGENGYIELVGVSANDRIPFLNNNKELICWLQTIPKTMKELKKFLFQCLIYQIILLL